MKKNKGTIYCSFCAKSEHEVKKLIAGPTVFICDDCVSLCVGIIQKSDSAFFNKIRCELKEDIAMSKLGWKTVDAPDEFWNLMDQQDIYERMSAAILQNNIDLTDCLHERAYQLMKKSREAARLAWKIIHEMYPNEEKKQMSAAHGIRKVLIEQ